MICRQGDPADGFYFIVSGRVDVSASTAVGGEAVHLASLARRDCFGEIALLENTHRTATITSTQDCVLLFLDRERFARFLRLVPEVRESEVFRKLLGRRTANSLKAIPLFDVYRTKQIGPLQQFDEDRLNLLGQLFRFVQFADGQAVFREGDAGDAFYVIVQGEVRMFASGAEGAQVQLGTLRQGDWFGEVALVHPGSRRPATCVAQGALVTLALHQENFARFLRAAPEMEPVLRARLDVRTAARLRSIPFFAGVRENKPWSKMDLLGGLFAFEEFGDGAVVFEQNQLGDKFYIIVDGRCNVSVNRGRGEQVIDRLKGGDYFGEIALMRDTLRTARVTCEGRCLLLSITADKFQKFLKVAPELAEPFGALIAKRVANVLQSLDLFAQVRENRPWSKLEMLATLFYYERAPAGAVIYRQGDEPDRFYVVVKGRVALSVADAAGGEREVGSVGENAHFGEVALLSGARRSVTARAAEACVLLCIDAANFGQFLQVAPEMRGYFESILRERARRGTLVPDAAAAELAASASASAAAAASASASGAGAEAKHDGP